ncbi:conserved membrane hypothetical protein [Frankia canadensis]|uniref:Uncharacterized protein n=1 Tax=Frankia canadensis TaxID=1836972 RepID=A0A2I2KJF5_9ACTN|nr:hypothetical protein [Frankia canadensis]SNQ45790.1 conserved membrane hypothetical protein [Frankia canadensis]SOU53080.1 conserved membrane hypothetical protein [Frankia canadensis]
MNTTLTRANKVGLALATVLALVDLALFSGDLYILLTSTLMGAVTLVAVIVRWRRSSRVALRAVAASRIVSGAVAIPVYFEGSDPGTALFATLFVLATVASVGLSMARPSMTAAPQTQV